MNHTHPTATTPPLGLALRILLPFAAGYFLSYLFRSVNAVIAPELGHTLQLDAATLGGLTSVYFLTFALFQLPLGLLLDRYGPRRVESLLLLVAAGGALLFASSHDLAGLTLGRALIGLGVSACLMASFQLINQWFPAEKVPAMNGWILASGGLGALSATRPIEIALGFTDWRGVMLILAVLTVLVAALIWLTTPERHTMQRQSLGPLLGGIATIFRDTYFWRIVPLVVATQATFLAIQGLWAGPWFSDVAGLDRVGVANHLLFTAVAMVCGFLLIGQIASRLNQFGVPLVLITLIGMSLFMLAQLGIILELLNFTLPLWLLFGFFGSSSILSYPLLNRYFPKNLTGRVNTNINLLVFASAFLVQWLMGGVIDGWPAAEHSGYQPQGYQLAFGLMLGLQLLALIWFILGLCRPVPVYGQ